MSNAMLTAVLDHSRSTLGARLTLIVLADRAFDDGYCRPGYDYLMARTNLRRTPLANNLSRLEQAGELYIDHSNRGNQYLILVGKSDAEIAEALVARFAMLPGEADLVLEAIHQRQASQAAPSRRGRNFSQSSMEQTTDRTAEIERETPSITGPQSSIQQTTVVYSTDNSRLLNRHDPLLPLIAPQITGANAPVRPGETPPKKVRPRDLLFDALAECAFGVRPGQEMGKRTGARVGMLKAELVQSFETPPDPLVIRRAYEWWDEKPGHPDRPRDPVKVVALLRAYLAEHSPTPGALHPPDPHCPICHGSGHAGNPADGFIVCDCRKREPSHAIA